MLVSNCLVNIYIIPPRTNYTFHYGLAKNLDLFLVKKIQLVLHTSP